MTRTPDDARYRPRPGDTRTLGSTARVVTRANDWAVEAEIPDARDPAATRIVLAMGDWSSGPAAFVWTPKVRTAEDARLDPLPGDTLAVGPVHVRVVSRDGDKVTVTAVDGMLTEPAPGGGWVAKDEWSVALWSDLNLWTRGGVWTPG